MPVSTWAIRLRPGAFSALGGSRKVWNMGAGQGECVRRTHANDLPHGHTLEKTIPCQWQKCVFCEDSRLRGIPWVSGGLVSMAHGQHKTQHRWLQQWR
jgi:hypothetical protein